MSDLQPCPTCKAVACCGDNPFAYSLVRGPVYGNDQISINVECPPGFRCVPGVYTIPKNDITLVVTNNEAGVLRIQCCQGELSQPVPAGATESEIGAIAQALVNACAVQQAQCNASQFFSRRVFRSEVVSFNGCANQGLLMGYLSSPPNLPPALYFFEGAIYMKAATFTSYISQEDANQKARTFLENYVVSLLFQGVYDCGYWNEELECPE